MFIRRSCTIYGTLSGRRRKVASGCPRTSVGEVMASAVKLGYTDLEFSDDPPELVEDDDNDYDPDREF